MTMPRRLNLVIPGLLGPWPEQMLTHLPDAPSLGRLLSCADRHAGSQGLEAQLSQLFGLQHPLPVAALRRLARRAEPAETSFVCCDPIHLLAGQYSLVLGGYGELLQLEEDEAQAFCRELNQTFESEGYRFEADSATCWSLNQDIDSGEVRSPAQLLGQALPSPRGSGQASGETRQHQRLMAEVQMLLHQSPINQQREAEGRVAINSLWFWGSGHLPATLSGSCDYLYSHDLLARGLCDLQTGCDSREVPRSAEAWLAEAETGAHLILLNGLQTLPAMGDFANWHDLIERMEGVWFAPLYEALRQGRIDSLDLYPCDGNYYSLRRSHLRRFWRRGSLAKKIGQVDEL